MDHQSSYQSTKHRTNTVDIYNGGDFNGAHGEDLVEITTLYRYFIDAGLDPRTATTPVEYESKCATSETPRSPVASTPATSALRNQEYEQRRVCSDSALLSKRGDSEPIDDFLLDIDAILLSGGSLVFSASGEVEDYDSSMLSFARDSICLTRERNKKNNKRPMIMAPSSTQPRHPAGPSE